MRRGVCAHVSRCVGEPLSMCVCEHVQYVGEHASVRMYVREHVSLGACVSGSKCGSEHVWL